MSGDQPPAAAEQPQQLSPQQQRMQHLLEQHQAAFAAKAAAKQPQGRQQQQPLQKRQRVGETVVAELALEQQLPQYAVGRQWSRALGGGSVSRARRPFASLLLAPSAVLEPPAAAALEASSGLGPSLRWALLPGGPAGCQGGTVPQLPAVQNSSAGGSQAPAPAVEPVPAVEAEPRYFASAHGDSAAAAPGASAAAPTQPSPGVWWTRQYEQLLQQRPEDEQLWLSYAVRHAVEAGRASGGRGGRGSPSSSGGGSTLTPGV